MGLIAISSLMLLGGMYLMIAFAWWLLQIIANWRIFTKAGEADGKVLFQYMAIIFLIKSHGNLHISG